MNYEKIYNQLISKRKSDPANLYGYAEHHHIIPRCMGGDDDIINMVYLTAREHFIAHMLLCLIYKNTDFYNKLFMAVTFMKSNKTGLRYFNSHVFELLRINATANYKLSKQSEYYRVEHFKKTFHMRKYHDKDYVIPLEERLDIETRFCKCGCGTSFICKISNPKQYVGRHASSDRSDAIKTKVSDKLKDHIAQLTTEELKMRMAKSFGNCDKQKKNAAISAAKKGVKTNQPLLEEIKYGTMNELEFNEYIFGRKEFIIRRMTNRRMKYLENLKSDNMSQYKDLKSNDDK